MARAGQAPRPRRRGLGRPRPSALRGLAPDRRRYRRWSAWRSGPSSHSISSAARPFLAAPIVIGDDGDGIVEPHHLVHALDRQRLCCRSTLLELAAEHRQAATVRDLHARHLDVDAEERRAVDLAGVSSRLAGVPMSLKSFGSLSATLSGTGSFAALLGQRAVVDACAAVGVWIDAALSRRGRCGHRRSKWRPPRRSAWCGRWRRPGAAAGRRRAPRSSRRSPESRPAD